MSDTPPRQTDPCISVFIPVYNRAHLIGRAIDSVLAQGFGDFELLIIDDGSSDESVRVVENYSDPRIRLLKNEVNRGIPVTRQRGLNEARGRYFALLDSDDWMYRNRLHRQVEYLERHPFVACVGGSVHKYHPDGRSAGRLVRPLRPAEIHVWLLFRNAFANTSLMGRTDILRAHGYRADYQVSEDYDLAARLAINHRIANLPQVMTYMLEHDGRTTRQHSEESFLTKTAIMKVQLNRLDVTYTAEDIERHYRLSRLRAQDLKRWPDYLDWTRQWLARLVEANQRTAIYDPQAMRGVLGLIWAQCCLKAQKRDGAGRTIGRLIRRGSTPAPTPTPTWGTARLVGDQLSARLRSTDRSARLPPQYR